MSIDASIVIATQQSSHHEWMAFACWYSVHRNLPENKVAVVFPRSFKQHQFAWLNKCHVPYLAYPADATTEQAVETLIENKVITKPVLILQDCHMVIREIDDSITDIVPAEILSFYADCSSEDAAAIVNYQKCGKFILDEWKEEQKYPLCHPFYRTQQLVGRNRTVNEQRVFQLWRQMGVTFDFLNR